MRYPRNNKVRKKGVESIAQIENITFEISHQHGPFNSWHLSNKTQSKKFDSNLKKIKTFSVLAELQSLTNRDEM